MRMRNFSPHTQDADVRAVAAYARHSGRSPDQLDSTHVREYLLHVVRRNKAWSTYNVTRCALHFSYRVTLRRDWAPGELVCAKPPKRLPVILSRDEVGRLLAGIRRIKTRAMLTTLYATGLRVSELVRLTASDIDSRRMTIRVRQGKGQKDRYVMLSPKLLALLREYWRVHRPGDILFPGADPGKTMGRGAVHTLCRTAARHAGITKPVSPHSFRHAFATHLLEGGIDLRTIQALLGHRSIRTTALYTYVSPEKVRSTPSPFDTLDALDSLPATPASATPGGEGDA